MKEAKFYKKLENGVVQCQLCPKYCIIKDGFFGDCNTRKNISGKLYSIVYNKPIALNQDPIEKKPLYHFFPRELAFSIGTMGCNLHCKFCQNWEISQSKPKATIELKPEQIIEEAKLSESKIIAYTYTEPTVFYEYMLDIAKLAKKKGLKNVIVSNGFINEEPLKELSKYIDAANIDLKSIRDKFYREESKAWLEPVLNSLKFLKKKNIWLEITNLMIPTLNDNEKEIIELINWIKNNLGDSVPLHFTAFYPCYKRKDLFPTPKETIKKARELALNLGLKYVYAGNILDWKTNSTYCPNCGGLLIKRVGFEVMENNIVNGKCKFCNEKIAGVFK